MTNLSPSKKSLLKFLSYFLIVFFLIVVAFFLSLPSILSTNPGKEWVLHLIEKNQGRDIKIHSLSLSWFQSQKIDHLSISQREPKDKSPFLSIDEIHIDAPLWKLLLNPGNFSSFKINGLNSYQLENTALTNVTVYITPSSISINGKTKQNALEGDFVIDALLKNITAENLLKMNGKWEDLLKNSSEAELKINIAISHFPVIILDQLISLKYPHLATLLPKLLGDELNIQGNPTVTPEGIIITVEANTPKLKTKLSFKIDDSIHLEKISKINLTLSKSDVEEINPRLQLESPLQIEVALNRFSLPLTALHDSSNPMRKVWKTLDSSIQITTSPVELRGSIPLDNINFREVLVELNTYPEKTPTAVLTAIASLPIESKVFHHVTLHGDALLEIDRNGNLYLDSLKVLLSNPEIHVSAEAKIHDLSALKANGTVKINQLNLTKLSNLYKKSVDLDSSGNAFLDVFTIDWTVNGGTDLIIADYNGMLSLPKKASSDFSGAVYIKDLTKKMLNKGTEENSKEPSVQFNLEAPKIPVELLEELVNKQELSSIIGNAITLSLNGNLRLLDVPEGFVEVAIKSPNVKGDLSLSIDKTIHLYENGQPSVFDFTLTPAAYSYLRYLNDKAHAADFSLAEEATITLRLNKLNLLSSIQESEIGIDLFINRLAVMENKSKQLLSLSDLKAHFTTQNLMKKVTFSLFTYGQKAEEGTSSWDLSGALENGLNLDGSLNLDSLSLSLDMSVNKLPIAMLCRVACNATLGQQVNAIIGPTLNGKIETKLQNMNGPIFAKIEGRNGHIQIEAAVKDNILTLSKNIEAETILSQDFSQHVLQTFVPIAANLIPSNQPVHLSIDKQGFNLPISDFNFETTSIGLATIEIGMVSFTHDSQIAQVFSLLKPGVKENLVVQFTPAYFSLTNGTIKLERLDLLVNNDYPMLTWGTIDLVKERVNMVIGLFGNGINKALGIDNISRTYVLQIPLKGPLSSPSIDKTKAATRISSLLAQTQGGAQGIILGTVLDLAVGSESVPPLTSPLPWKNLVENKAGDTHKNSSSDQRKQSTPEEHQLEEAGKAAGQLIKKLLKK